MIKFTIYLVKCIELLFTCQESKLYEMALQGVYLNETIHTAYTILLEAGVLFECKQRLRVRFIYGRTPLIKSKSVHLVVSATFRNSAYKISLAYITTVCTLYT